MGEMEHAAVASVGPLRDVLASASFSPFAHSPYGGPSVTFLWEVDFVGRRTPHPQCHRHAVSPARDDLSHGRLQVGVLLTGDGGLAVECRRSVGVDAEVADLVLFAAGDGEDHRGLHR